MTTATSEVAQAPAWTPNEYDIVTITDTEHAIEELKKLLSAAAKTAIDTETVIIRDADGDPIKVNLTVDGPGPWRVMSIASILTDGTKRALVLDMAYVDPRAIAPMFAGLRPFGWNASFDRGVLGRGGIGIRRWWDAMLAEAVLTCGAAKQRKYKTLADAAWTYLRYDIAGKKGTRLDYQTAEVRPQLTEDEVLYAAIDAIATLEVALVIGKQLSDAGLVDTFVRECNAEPFIHAMEFNGFPIDAEGYAAVIESNRQAAADAAEQVALLTSGEELLTTVVNWHTAARGGSVNDVITEGLAILHDPDTFAAFLADVGIARDTARDRMAEILGATTKPDLFSADPAATYLELPFDPDHDVSVRGWISSNAKHFAAAWALAAREEGELAELFTADATTVIASAGRRGKLTKEHSVEEILAVAADQAPADITETVRQVCIQLQGYLRYQRILETYKDLEPGAIPRLVPAWNMDSDEQVKTMLNTRFTDLVEAYLFSREGERRVLGKADSVNADALKLIGGPLCEALLKYRKHVKIVSTYGDELLKFVHEVTGRIHARYSQALTGTGRLSSEKPNAQNLSPLAKPYIRPATAERCFVLADLSQAELRFVAHAAQDKAMLEAFRAGIDLHAVTASLMFGVDLLELIKHGQSPLSELVDKVKGLAAYAAETPQLAAEVLYGLLRQKAKAVAFGYNYGLKGASLANQLTVQGVPTSKEEADDLLKRFDLAYPELAAWMAARKAFIDDMCSRMRDVRQASGVDFANTWLLHHVHAKSKQAYNALTQDLGRRPSEAEMAVHLKPNPAEDLAARLGREASEDEIAAEMVRVGELATWALQYSAGVVLGTSGKPWSFESRTPGGRRRLFEVRTDYLMMSVVTYVSRARNANIAAVADGWARSWNDAQETLKAEAKAAGKRYVAKTVSLTKADGRTRLDSAALEKLFEDRARRTDFVTYCLSTFDAATMEKVWRHAMADCIRALANQYRNHPIQGGVADAMELAYAEIDEEMSARFPTAQAIQTVHDSIVVECDIVEAFAIREMVTGHMEAALAVYCPSVPCVADGEIGLSLDKKGLLTDEQVAARANELTLAA